MASGKHSSNASRRRGGKAPVAVGILIVAAIAVAGLFIAHNFLEKPGEVKDGQEITVTVPEGAAASQIADILKEEGVISSASAFLDAVKERDAASQFKPGTYKLVGGSSVDQVLDVLVSGKTGNVLTVPEGYTVKQIAEAVESTCGISSEEFETLAHTAKDFEVEYAFLKDAYQGSMEGFLFPSTYEVPFDSTANDVIKLMLDEYGKRIADVDLGYAEKKGLSSYDVLIIASMIEKEAVDGDQANISDVVYNRLEKDMALGIDATTYYAVGKDMTEELTQADLDSNSPYNTRNTAVKGLPPSPICSPGMDSIKAAAKPSGKGYLYYFHSSKKDKTMFFKTSEEFEAAKKKYL